MQEPEATEVVERLRARGRIASLARVGLYRFGVRVPLPDGREVLWDADGAAGLEAQIMRDGVLVGFVPTIPGSENLDPAGVAEAIAAARYDEV